MVTVTGCEPSSAQRSSSECVCAAMPQVRSYSCETKYKDCRRFKCKYNNNTKKLAAKQTTRKIYSTKKITAVNVSDARSSEEFDAAVMYISSQ